MRSSDALRIRKRYAFCCTFTYGYAVPFTSGVSMNDSGMMVGLGVPGFMAGSPIAGLASGLTTGPFMMPKSGGNIQNA